MATHTIDGIAEDTHEMGLVAAMEMAEQAIGCVQDDPEGAWQLSDTVVAWSLGERHLLTHDDAWTLLCALPIQALAHALDTPDGPYGLLLAHACDALPNAMCFHPHQHRLSRAQHARLEHLGLGYARMDPDRLRDLWIRTGSAYPSGFVHAAQDKAPNHVAMWWRIHGFVAPDNGFSPHLASAALAALETYLAMPRIPHIVAYLAKVLDSTRAFDPRVLVPVFAVEAPAHRPLALRRDSQTTSVLLAHPALGAGPAGWRDLFLAVSPDTKSAHHILARKALLDRMPPLEAILSMERVPDTPEDLFALRRSLDAAQAG